MIDDDRTISRELMTQCFQIRFVGLESFPGKRFQNANV